MDRQTLSFYADIASLIGLLGFILVLIQLCRTQSAAKAAAKAAAESAQATLSRISNIVAVVSVGQICNRASEVLNMTRADNYGGAVVASIELRKDIAKFSASPVAMEVSKPKEWRELTEITTEIHLILEKGAQSIKIDRHDVIEKTSKIIARFSTFESILSQKFEDNNRSQQVRRKRWLFLKNIMTFVKRCLRLQSKNE
jgi:hypothetical protein